MLLIHTGVSRTASEVAEDKIKKIKFNFDKLTFMKSLVSESIEILTNNRKINEFGDLLKISWDYKKAI